jgi:hypothetical protein
MHESESSKEYFVPLHESMKPIYGCYQISDD